MAYSAEQRLGELAQQLTDNTRDAITQIRQDVQKDMHEVQKQLNASIIANSISFAQFQELKVDFERLTKGDKSLAITLNNLDHMIQDVRVQCLEELEEMKKQQKDQKQYSVQIKVALIAGIFGSLGVMVSLIQIFLGSNP